MDELNSRVAAVTVFPDRARVSRVLSVEVAPGVRLVELGGLPMALDPASVQANATGSATATLLGVEVRKSYFATAPSEHVQELERQLEALRDQDQGHIDQIQTLAKQLEHLDGLSDSTRTYAFALSNGKSDLETHAALLDFLDKRRSEALAATRSLTLARNKLEKDIARVKKELERLHSARPAQRYTAVVEFEVHTQGQLDVTVDYILPGCSWRPAYDLRLTDQALEVHYRGQVQQASGEDWQGVALTLSTAYPSIAGVMPELEPWFIYEHRPQPLAEPGRHAPQVMPAAQMPAPVTDSAGEARLQATPREAEVDQSGAAANYRITTPLNLPGDGSPRKTTITRLTLQPELDYVTSPKITAAAYRRLKVSNDSPYMLLPGRAQLFEGTNYLGATALELTSPGQEFELFFGVDDRLRVKRELIRRETDKSLIGERRRVRFAYQIEVENHTGAGQRVLVRDQMPVGRHEDIKVKLERSEPRQPAQDELNRIEWELNLEAGQQQVLRFDFTVEHPRGLNVIGLP